MPIIIGRIVSKEGGFVDYVPFPLEIVVITTIPTAILLPLPITFHEGEVHHFNHPLDNNNNHNHGSHSTIQRIRIGFTIMEVGDDLSRMED